MKSGFAHFDGSHRENFCAAVLLLVMELDDAVRTTIATKVRDLLDLGSCELVGFGREARLESTDETYARVDIWLLFASATEQFDALIEVKTHTRWDPHHVHAQVHDQVARGARVRSSSRVRGSVLLAPEALCRSVRALDPPPPTMSWPDLLRYLRALPARSQLTDLAIQHLEQTMDHPAGLDRGLTMSDFERATTTISCLRQFLLECITEMKGNVRGDPVYLTPGDGTPRRYGGWAWHGLAIPFTHGERRGRLGIYKYDEAPVGEESAKENLWLEVYLGDVDTPAGSVPFNPATLAATELSRLRDRFVTSVWAPLATTSVTRDERATRFRL